MISEEVLQSWEKAIDVPISEYERFIVRLIAAYREARKDNAALRALLGTVDDMLCDVAQLIDGWKNTTPVDEWSEWDEQTRQKRIQVHRLVLDAAREASKP